MVKKYSENQIIVPRFNEENGFYTTKQRSRLMSKIKAKNTKPELRLRKALWLLGYRYRINVKKLPGKPDIVFSKYRLAIFIDGEFWHGFNWSDKKEKIKTNRGFWIPKIERNIQRDNKNNELLINEGWHILRFWESQIEKDIEGCINQILDHINNYKR